MKRITALLITIVVCVSLCGCCLSHEWADATCAAPKTCMKCGKTEGEPIAHTWKDATCAAPKTCEECGATEGEPLAHTWKDATCTAPKTCKICGATEGNMLEHVPSDWVAENPKVLGGKEIQKCTVCDKKLDSRNSVRGEKQEITVLEPTQLVMTSEEFANHLINYLPDDCYITNIKTSGFKIEGKVDVDVIYNDEEHSYKDDIMFKSKARSDIKYLLKFIIPAVDPNMTGNELSEAITQAEKLLDNYNDGAVPLYTGVGAVHYSEAIRMPTMTISSFYVFGFFTLQDWLS